MGDEKKVTAGLLDREKKHKERESFKNNLLNIISS
jgi:hypothetical protein